MTKTKSRKTPSSIRTSRAKLPAGNEAVIYCRVSDKSQVERGNGLDSQETTCREYAARMEYLILEVFSDDFTGKSTSREGLKALLVFLKKQKRETKVIIDDGTRLARSPRAHFTIRDAISTAGGKLESPKRIYADDPEDDVLEMIEAIMAGEHRKKNAEQTVSRMRARCLDGHWCLQLPTGYKYRQKESKNDRSLILRDEPVATIVRNALEGFACGHLTTQADVARFLANEPEFPKQYNGRVSDDMAKRILKNPLYAGYVQVPAWDVSLRPGHHPALISFETHQRIQRRLASHSKGIVRTDNSADFPLRGHVVCACCKTKLTAYWAKQRQYPYYHCREESCEAYARTISRAKIEGEFTELLRSLEPAPARFEMVKLMLRQLWDGEASQAVERKKSLATQIREVDSEIRKLVDRVIDTESQSLIAAYEKRINEAEARKVELAEIMASCGKPRASFDEAFSPPYSSGGA